MICDTLRSSDVLNKRSDSDRLGATYSLFYYLGYFNKDYHSCIMLISREYLFIMHQIQIEYMMHLLVIYAPRVLILLVCQLHYLVAKLFIIHGVLNEYTSQLVYFEWQII